MANLRLGVIGTFVWDVIHGRDTRTQPIEEWGGIAYALGALDASLPAGWDVVPLVRVGEDLALRAREFLGSLRRIAPDAAIIEVPYPNNRVELRYFSDERRSEILSGGIPGWHWLGLKPLLRDIDALYVNLISGFELDLETALLVRQHYTGPIYADLHSLLLAVQPGGLRTPRPLPMPEARAWMSCFDLIQVNEDEMALMSPEPMTVAAAAISVGVRALTVTLGPRGAAYFAAPGFSRLEDLQRSRQSSVAAGPVRTALVPARLSTVREPDPTGCGDVWGATYFSRLLGGATIDEAMRDANAAAARNVEHKGATGLAQFLRGELSRP